MTTALSETDPAASELAANIEPVRNEGATRALVWIGLAVGSGLMAYTYWLAEHHPEQFHQRYLLFWLAFFAVLVPVTVRLLDPLPTASERQAVLIAFALFTVVPKYLRNNRGPLFFDELAHWRQSERLFDTGALLEPNALVKVIDAYPGLHVLTASLRHLTGLSTQTLAIIVLVIVHVGVLLAVFRIAQILTDNDRIAGLAGVIYALNPAFLFFNSQYAYQTLAVLFLVWALAMTLESTRHRGSPPVGFGFSVLAAGFGVAAVVTHHVVGFLTALLLIACAVAIRLKRAKDTDTDEWRTATRQTTIVAVVVSASAVIWLIAGSRFDPGRIIGYLSVYPLDGLQELLRFGDTGNRHRIFTVSNLPVWMKWLGWLAPILAIAIGAKGFIELRKNPRRHPLMVVFVVLAGTYVVSLPLILTKTGAQGAHRSFPFTYIGLCVLMAIGVTAWHRQAFRVSTERGQLITAALTMTLAMLAIGNLASNANDLYLFPGPWAAASDVRAYNEELEGLVDWFDTQNVTERIAVDTFTGAPIAALSDPNAGCRLSSACDLESAPWAVFLNDNIDAATIDKLRDDGYGYLVVERRMSSDVPRTGFWFNRNEPGAFEYEDPIADSHLTRFRDFPWTNLVYSSEHLDVYRLDLERFGQQTELGERSAK